jgi:hypothetical protein
MVSISNPKIINLLSCAEFRFQPTGLLPSACPGLGRLRWISILRKNLRVRAPRVAHLFSAAGCDLADLAQSLLKPCFFG